MTIIPRFLVEAIEKSMDYSPKAFWRAQAFSVNPKILPQILSSLPSRDILKKLPIITASIVHTYRMGFHVDFSSAEDVMGCGPNLPSCNPKVGADDTLNHWEFKNSQEPQPKDFCVNMPLESLPGFMISWLLC